MASLLQQSELICPKCKTEINIINNFTICNCGTFPINIILPKLKGTDIELAEKLKTLLTPINLTVQNNLQTYMKLGTQRLLDHKFGKKFKILGEATTQSFVALGDVKSVIKTVKYGKVIPTGTSFIIPSLICNKYFAGIWVVHPLSRKIEKYISILKGGIAFSHTVTTKTVINNKLFIYQNLLTGLEDILEGYKQLGFFPPIIAHPQLSIHQDIGWIPKAKYYLVVNEFLPAEYKHLLPYDPDVVLYSNISSFGDRFFKFFNATQNGIPLRNLLQDYISVTAKDGIYVANNQWYYHPANGVCCNLDIVLSKYFEFDGHTLLHGKIMYEQQVIPFTVMFKAKRHFYKKIKQICVENNILLACAPTVRHNFLDIVLLRNRKLVFQQKNQDFGCQRRTIILPHLEITRQGIKQYDQIDLPKFPGNNLRITTTATFRYSLEMENQLAVLVSVLLCISALARMNKRISIGYPNSVNRILLENLLKAFGILRYPTSGVRLARWPYFATMEEMENWEKDDPRQLFIGDELQLALINMINPGVIVKIPSIYPPLLKEEIISSSAVQTLYNILQIDKLTGYYPYTILHSIFNTLQIPKNLQKSISKKFYWPLRTSEVDNRNVLLCVMLKYNLLHKHDFKNSMINGIRKYVIPVEYVNSRLNENKYPPMLSISTADKLIEVSPRIIQNIRNIRDPYSLYRKLSIVN